jgi:ADP-heptose:LPS heptosyltransferase
VKLLFVTATRLGDAVLSTGLLDRLIARHPGIHVTIACGAPAAPIFAGVPGLERTLVLVKQPLAAHWFSLWASTCATRWDVAVDLRGSALTMFLRCGHAIVDRGARPDLHRVAELGALIGEAPPPSPRLWLTDIARRDAQRLIPTGAPLLVVAPAANWRAKIWPAERFVAVIRALTAPSAPLAGARVAVVAAAEERTAIAEVLEAVPPDRLIDLACGHDLLTIAACLERAALFIGNDSGLMHLAGAVGAPTLGLFGPSREQRYAPWGERAAFVRTPQSYEELVGAPGYDHRNSSSLMTGLDVEAVLAAARRLLASP